MTTPANGFVPLDIVGIAVDQITMPGDEGPGRGLYCVPIRLSRSLDYEEVALLTALWAQAPKSAGTRSGARMTARVMSDEFRLTETTIDDVAETQAHALRLVVDRFNEARPAALRLKAEDAARAEAAEADHRRYVQSVSSTVRFD